MTMKVPDFIKINNCFILEDTEEHLSSKELYLYSILLFEKHLKTNLKTNIILLSSIINDKFGSNRTDKLYRNVRSVMKMLAAKKAITITTIEYEPLEDNYKNNELILINFNGHHEVENGFTQVYEDKFYEIENIYHYHIYVATKKWDGVKFFECSYDRWERILNKSRQFVFDNIDEAVEKGIIFRSVGDYYLNEELGKKIQQSNKYKSTPFDLEEKSNIDIKKTTIEENDSFHKDHTYGDMSELNLINGISVFGTEEKDGIGIFPKSEDYVFFMRIRDKSLTGTTNKTEKRFLDVAEKRISKLNKDGNAAFHETWKQASHEYKVQRDYVDISDYF